MRRGRQAPTFEHVTGYDTTRGPEAVALFGSYGVRFIPAQEHEMDLFLARNELGECAAVTIGLSRPRQNGKSFAARHYALWCAFVEGRSVLYSAHNGSTTRKMFKLMCDFIEANADFSRALRPGGQGVYKAQGSEGIYLAGGASIEFSTRTNSGARGGTYDVIVVDEAQELTDEQRDALMPTTIASDSGDPQVILVGTPPNHKCPGTVFRDLHDRAHAGELGDSWWLEWAADDVGDPRDAERWYECNPMMGYRISERSMASAADTTPPDSFAREYLGWWSAPAAREALRPAIGGEAWEACLTLDPPAPAEGELYGVGAKFSADGSRVALAVCVRPEGRRPYVEVVASRSTSHGTRWLAEWLLEREDKVASVAIDGRRGERAVQMLADGGFPRRSVRVPAASDVARACSMLVDAVEAGEVEHWAQPDLDAAAAGCPKRRIGQDGFGFDDAEGADATLIEACALAYREAMAGRGSARRKLRVAF